MDSSIGFKHWISAAILCCGAVLFIGSCDSAENARSSLSSLIPSLGIASPTSSGGRREATSDVKTITEVKAALADVLAKTTATDCFSGVSFNSFNDNVQCYGPQLAYSNHPGGSGSGTCMGGTVTSGNCLPSGDLGIWSATETSSGEACSAAKLNALTGDVAESINSAMKFMAAMICVAQVSGKEKPEVGASVDIATEVQAGLSGSTITTATITRLADYTGTTNPVYQMTLAGTYSSNAFTLNLKHSFSTTDSSVYKGRFYGYFGSTNYKGFSFTYDQVSSTDLRYDARQALTASANGTNLFDSNGVYQYTTFTSNNGTNARYTLANIDPSTGLGSLKFAWQAGGNDVKARVFHASVSRASGTDTGFSYFGFGPNVANASVGDINGMCCNWAGPGGTCIAGAASYDIANRAQSQTFSRTGTTAIFTPTASNIAYAPTNTCIHTPATTFKYALVPAWGADGSTVSAADVAAHSLTTLTAAGTMPSLSTPSFSP